MLGTQVRIHYRISRLDGETARLQAVELRIGSSARETDRGCAANDRLRFIKSVHRVMGNRMADRLDAGAMPMLRGGRLVHRQYQRDHCQQRGQQPTTKSRFHSIPKAPHGHSSRRSTSTYGQIGLQ
jgi:hypothetical protein